VLCVGLAVVAEPGGKIMLESRVTSRQGRIAPKSVTEGQLVQIAA
jgi:hypothetical protein